MNRALLQLPGAAPMPAAEFFPPNEGKAGASTNDNGVSPHEDVLPARRWFLLSVGSLLVAGLFALLLVVGRVPPLNLFITDADFFQRCLVVHVNLSLLVWFSAFVAGMFSLIPGQPAPRKRARSLGFFLALAGVVAMSVSAFLPGTTPILSNYIPFIEHPLFGAGLIAFLGGLTFTYLQGRFWAGFRNRADCDNTGSAFLPPETAIGVRFSVLAFLVAVITFVAAWAATPRDLPATAYYEFLVWGGGHVLQVANVAAMIAIWLFLLRKILNRPLVSPAAACVLFGLLVAPHLVSPLLTIEGTTTALYHRGATELMRWGIFPVVTVFLILAVWRLVKAGRHARPAASGPADRTIPRGAGLSRSIGPSPDERAKFLSHQFFGRSPLECAASPLRFQERPPRAAGREFARSRLRATQKRCEDAPHSKEASPRKQFSNDIGSSLDKTSFSSSSGEGRMPQSHRSSGEGRMLQEAAFWRRVCLIGFSLSVAMTVAGFVLGAMIRDSNTMVPAHYHASIGAVTVAFMAMSFLLLKPLAFYLKPGRLKRLIPWQLGLFGIGQLVFALGFAIGGAYGLDRKAYGSDQHVASAGEYIGLAVMGGGGLLAVAGGVLFLVLIIAAGRPAKSVSIFS